MFKGLISALLLCATAVSAQAQEVYWKKSTVTVQATGSETTKVHKALFNRVVVNHNYYECGYPVDPVVSTAAGTCYDVSCKGGAGKSVAWDAFFAARKAAKPTKLASAIKGVGKASAEGLVNGGYFSSKPRSWDAFKAEINDAAAKGAITDQVKTLVLSTYREENIATLGYAGGSCTSTPYPCNQITIIREGYYVSETCDDKEEQVIDTRMMNYTINVKNSVLLPDETDSLNVELSGEASEVKVGTAVHNKYVTKVTAQDPINVQVDIEGVARNQVNLPESSIVSVDLQKSAAKAGALQVTVTKSALPAAATEQLVAELEVRTCTAGWTGLCGPGWDNKQTISNVITQQVSSFEVPNALAKTGKKVKMEVEVKIYKKGSIYHNAKAISKTTKTISFDK